MNNPLADGRYCSPGFQSGVKMDDVSASAYGADDLPGGSDGFDAHTIRLKSVPFHEMDRA
jgi:hypothetical protein